MKAAGAAGSLLRGSIVRTLDLLVAVGAAFFVTPYLVRSLGDRVFGFWTLAMAFVGYYGLLDLGLTSAASRYLSRALGAGDDAELERVAGTAFGLFSLIGLAVLLLAAATAAACPLFLRDPAEAATFRALVLIMGGGAALSFPGKVYSGLLGAALRYDVIAGLSIGRSILCNGGIVAALALGGGVVAVAVVTFAANAAQYAATWAAFRRSFPALPVRARAFDRERGLSMLGYGSKTLVCQLGDVLRFRLDTVLIAAWLGAALVTPYAVGARVVEAYVQLVFGSTGMMLPVFSRFEGQGDFAAIRGALLKTTKLTTIVSTFIGLSVIFYGRAFIRRWMGPGLETAYGVAAILAAGYVIELPQSPGIQVLYGLSKHHVYAWLSVCEGAVNVALSVWLLRRFGVYGVALGTALEFAVFKLFVQPFYICRAAGLAPREYYAAIFGALVKTAAPLGLYFAAAAPFASPSYGALAACVAVQAALFAPAAYFLILSREERRAVGSAAAALLPARLRAAPAATEG
jgi:O-antigen/teichoic acid export membrane protein